MKTLNYIQKLYPNSQLLGISQIYFSNSGWTLFEKDILFFSFNSVTTKHFDKVLKSMLLNDEMKIQTISFAINNNYNTIIYSDYTTKELLNIL
jgi:hypothetical protein